MFWVVLALAANLPGGPLDRGGAGDPVAAPAVQEGRRPDPEEPVLGFGDQRLLASWNDPCVLKRDGKYVMYLTTSTMLPGRPPVLPFRAVSDDGADDFDFQGVETPSVVFFRGRYHLDYTGVQKGLSGPLAIGHATSEDGIRGTKDDAPVPISTGLVPRSAGMKRKRASRKGARDASGRQGRDGRFFAWLLRPWRL